LDSFLSKVVLTDAKDSYASDSSIYMLSRIPDSVKMTTLRLAENSIRNVKSMLEVNKQNMQLLQINLTEHTIELHKRFSLPFACILLFIIGMALGSIIRKGGLGMPFIVAVSFFVLYYFLNTVGEKIAKEMVVPVYVGMWMPSAILGGIGLFLLIKANNDSPLMNKEWYYRTWQRIKQLFTKPRRV
jgi:Predicted permeases